MRMNRGFVTYGIVLNAAGQVRSDDKILQKLEALRDNVNELRAATRGDGRLFEMGLKQLAMLEGNALKPGVISRMFETVAKLMDFAKNDLPDLISDNVYYDPKSADDDNASEDVRSKYVLNCRLDGNITEKPLTSIAMVTTYLSDHVSELFHIQENILAGEKNIAHFADLKDPQKQITDYLTRTIQAFVSPSLDAGKIEDYLSYLGRTWPCVEGKTSGITEFRLTTCPPDDTGPVATHDKNQPLNQCIGREIAAIMEANPNVQEWKDVAAQVKTNLVGVIRPIDIPEKHVTKMTDGEELTTYQFKPVLGETGKPVVRAITEADIDALGEAVMDTILFG